MAENDDVESQIASNCIYNTKEIDKIIDRVAVFYEKQVEESLYCSSEEKKKIGARMNEIYRTALLENIQLANEPGSNNERESTTDWADNPTEKHLNQVVLPELDSLICAVAEQRKTAPPFISQIVDQHSNIQLKSTLQEEFEVEPAVIPHPNARGIEIEKIGDFVSDSCTKLKDISKNIHKTLGAVKDLQDVQDMHSTNSKTTTYKQVFPPTTYTSSNDHSVALNEELFKEGFGTKSDEPMQMCE